MTTPLHVSDHAILRYLERAHGLDVEAVRRHIASRCATGAELRATTVIVERVKFVLAEREAGTVVVTVLKARWPARPEDTK
ncbi:MULTISPECIES: hypothetical protein [unclassified Shinella]|uniref:hypothetical protein n=1 Tax=unclassified Shinella TaxID=2643062 RepID=UPI00225CFAC7|nr:MULTISPECIES: hypothetical protein [unclassified Shinella]CAI0339115.1 conserved hypothetical protein [Rhizobiaceae bacterium]CAK7257530.1 DUF4258 domain-containing protein [Shinella sp. WSC3-e]MCO5139013.1 hypothetical protein [Shinella sp.]MCW5711330.1 hypothetical protein [Shinella sp.]MDC7256258.1 hypothetical protein [Shinella sp. YE25]